MISNNENMKIFTKLVRNGMDLRDIFPTIICVEYTRSRNSDNY